jgi:hypothetical protein
VRPSTLAAAAAFALGAACAHVEGPPGGPEDKVPPALLVTRPDTLAVVPSWDAPAVLVFDERISERGVQDAVMVSPRTSMVVVDHRGDEIRVRLREGWRPNTIYHVTVQPGVQDLFNNPLAEPVTLVFSTGPEIPGTLLAGVVTDPITRKPEVGIRVEAIRAADSLVYAVPTDSAGEYRLGRIPEGEYRVRAFRDLNRNRALDDFEPRGIASVAVAAGDSARQALGVLMPDSTPPKIASAELRDSILELKFDDYLDPNQLLPPARVQIRSPEGRFVPAASITVGTPRAETPAAPRRQGREQPADTATAPLPSQSLLIRLAGDAEVEPGVTYSIRVRDLRNLAGLVGDVETELKVPAAPEEPRTPAPADTAAPPDTARAARALPARP